MTNPSRAFKRLGVVGAAAVVGLVPVALAGGPAFAASNATLSLASNAATASTTATNTFTTTQAGTNQISIAASSSTATGESLPACTLNSPTPPTVATCTNYTVSYTPSGGTATTDGVTAVALSGAGPNNTATLTLSSAIPAGAAVTVTISGVVNGKQGDVVRVTDTDTNTTTASSGTAAPSNTVTIGAAVPVPTPGVSSINPTAFNGTNGNPFTITGTNFQPVAPTPPGTGANQPIVCFVKSGNTTPAPTTGASNAPTGPCTGTGNAPATVNYASTTEIQGASPAGLAAGTYNVVVYNYDPNLGATGGYTAASGTTSQTLVGVSTNLNFVPESGVRIVDTRTGLNLPKSTLPKGTPVGIPLSDFAQSPTLPTNLPAGAPGTAYDGLAVNVTAVAPATGGNLQVWSAPSCNNGIAANGTATEPATVNFQPPQDTNNNQVIPVNAGDSTLCVQDNGAVVNAVIDLTGYTTSNYTQSNTRLLDTRTGQGGLLGPLQPNTVYQFHTTPGVTVALNVADVAPAAPGNLRVFPETAAFPCASNPATPSSVPTTAVTNYIVNTDSSAELITATSCNGNLDIYSASTGPVNVVIDKLGTFTAGTSLTALSQPTRILDTRPGPIPAAGTVTVTASPSGSGNNFVPSGALGVVGNLSDINPTGQGYEVTFPAGNNVPGTATIAHFPAQTRNTNAITALNPSNGSFSIYNSGASTNSTYDVSAYIS